MVANGELELLFLHALPLDDSMWAAQMDLLPDSSHAPTLYGLGDTIEAWADRMLERAQGNRLIVVGCSVGGSCALEVATKAPGRVAALVLIGTKARHSPDPALHGRAVRTLHEKGLEEAWQDFWKPLLSPSASASVVEAVKSMTLRQSVPDIARGVTVFHTRPCRDRFLAGFSGRVIVVSGADDVAPGPQMSAMQAGSTRNGQLHVIPDCGHYVPLERPDILNAILKALIDNLRTGDVVYSVSVVAPQC